MSGDTIDLQMFVFFNFYFEGKIHQEVVVESAIEQCKHKRNAKERGGYEMWCS